MKHSTLFSSSSNSGTALLQADKGIQFSGLLLRAVILGSMLLGFAVANGVSAQAATLSTQGIIQLPTDEALASTYTVDLSSMHFQSDQDMIDFIGSKNSVNFQLRALPNQGKAVLMLKLGKQPTWTVADWNAHLQSVCALSPIIHE